MAPHKSGSDTDPSTVAGTPSSELGGGGGAETFNNPLKNVYPPQFRISSNGQQRGGLINPLPSFPPAPDGYSISSFDGVPCVKDPVDGDLMVFGYFAGNNQGQDVPIISFDFESLEFSTDKYPALSGAANVNTSLALTNLAVAGTYVLAGGGVTKDGTGGFVSSDAIYYLDVSQNSPAWQVEEGALQGVEMAGASSFGYNGEAYFIGGEDADTLDLTPSVTKFNPSTGNLFQLNDIPFGFGAACNNQAPVVDGEAYIMGQVASGGTFEGETLDTNGLEFFKYTIETEEITKLSQIDVLSYAGSPSGEAGFFTGASCQINDDLLFYSDGDQYMGGVDAAIYSISRDEWAPFPDLTYDDLYDAPIYVQNYIGEKQCVINDGVIYVPSPDYDRSTRSFHQVFPPETFPESE